MRLGAFRHLDGSESQGKGTAVLEVMRGGLCRDGWPTKW